MDAFVSGVSSLAAFPFAAGSVAMLGGRSALGVFGFGAGFDMAGQSLQGGEYRFGQTLAAGGTALAYGPLAGRNLWGNAALGGIAGGSNTAVTNWMYDENKSVIWSIGLGAAAGGIGARLGEVIKELGPYIPSQVTVPYFSTPATFSVTLPSAGVLGGVAEKGISNIPAILSLPDANSMEQP